jgi:proteasome activator subunit 4
MVSHLLDSFLLAAGIDLQDYADSEDSEIQLAMSDDDDDVSLAAKEDDSSLSLDEKQRASLQIYLNSVPYECETLEEMQAKLEHMVGKIMICAHAKNWLLLTTWDGLLQWRVSIFRIRPTMLTYIFSWLLMRYPMPRATRAKLVRLYYELCLVPGLEPRVIRNWADMLSRLLSNKPGLKRKLESTDLELPWQPLWRVLQKELWPKKRLHENS